MKLTDSQMERYSRNILLQEVGVEGQRRLLQGKILLVGVGGLGSPMALYLCAAGVGTIGLIDADIVDMSNLQRQVIHFTEDVGRLKVLSAEQKMKALNPDVLVRVYPERLTAKNALSVLSNYDFVLDATDNFSSKFLIADACHFAGKPYSHGGILEFEGQTLTVKPRESACYRCVFSRAPSDGKVFSHLRVAGPLGVLPGVIGTIQATEAIKFLVGQGTLLTNCLLVHNALEMTFKRIHLKRNPTCPLCGNFPSITQLREEEMSEGNGGGGLHDR